MPFLDKAWNDLSGSWISRILPSFIQDPVPNPNNSCRHDFSRLNTILFTVCSSCCSDNFLKSENRILPRFTLDLIQDLHRISNQISLEFYVVDHYFWTRNRSRHPQFLKEACSHGILRSRQDSKQDVIQIGLKSSY